MRPVNVWQGAPKSSFLTEEKRARLKTNPVKVHFAEEVLVSGHSQVRPWSGWKRLLTEQAAASWRCLLGTLESTARRGQSGGVVGSLEALCSLRKGPAQRGQGETRWVPLCLSETPLFWLEVSTCSSYSLLILNLLT